MRRKPEIELTTFPTDPPELPTAAQLNAQAGILTHHDKELRARALELAIQANTYRAADAALFDLADVFLAYINGDQP